MNGVTCSGPSLRTLFHTVGTFDARVPYYPSATSGFFLTGGLGVGSVGLDVESDVGAILGLGADLRVG